MLGMDIGIVFAGAIFVERAFGLPGIGKLLISSLGGRDLPVILGIVVLVTTAILIFNLLVDLLYPLLDPRIGYGRFSATSSRNQPMKFSHAFSRKRSDSSSSPLCSRRTRSRLQPDRSALPRGSCLEAGAHCGS